MLASQANRLWPDTANVREGQSGTVTVLYSRTALAVILASVLCGSCVHCCYVETPQLVSVRHLGSCKPSVLFSESF